MTMLDIVQGFTNVMLSTGSPEMAGHADSPLSPEQALIGGQSRFLDGAWRGEAGARDYKLFVPAAYEGQSLPLVVMLHGCQQDPDDFAAGTRMNIIAEEFPCLVLYPGQSRTANGLNCWNWFSQDDQHRDGGEPAIIAGMVRGVIATWNVDTCRIYAAGLSAGGAMAVILGKTYPDLFAAIGVHSGLSYAGAHDLHSAMQAMREGSPVVPAPTADDVLAGAPAASMATIVFHGDHDTTVHPDNGDRVMEQISALPIEGEFGSDADVTVEQGQVGSGHSYTRTIHHSGERENIIAEQWLVHGAGHAWSGGSDDGSFSDPKGPDASREMMRFFLAQHKVL